MAPQTDTQTPALTIEEIQADLDYGRDEAAR